MQWGQSEEPNHNRKKVRTLEADEEYIETIRCKVEQEKINQEILDRGMSENVLGKQVALNIRRHEMNIADKEEIIYKEEDDKEFVQ